MNSSPTPSEQAPGVWGLVGTLVWGFVVIAALYVTQALVFGAYIAHYYGDISGPGYDQETVYGDVIEPLLTNGTLVAWSTIAAFVVCTPLILGLIRLRKNANITSYLGLRLVSLANLKHWFLIVIAFLLLSELLTTLLGNTTAMDFMRDIYTSAQPLWLLWFALIIAAPVFEEVFFRGFLITGLASSPLGPIGAIFSTSLLWAMIHFQYDLYGVISIFVLGLLLGYARLRTGSVLLPMILHGFVNLVSTLQVDFYLR